MRGVLACPRCATPNPAQHVFCDDCGARLRDAFAPVAITQQPAVGREASNGERSTGVSISPPARPATTLAAEEAGVATTGPALTTAPAESVSAAGVQAVTATQPASATHSATSASPAATAELPGVPSEPIRDHEPVGSTVSDSEVAAPGKGPTLPADEPAPADNESEPVVPAVVKSGPTLSLALAGLGLAGAGELYLQYAAPADRTKLIGVGMLVVGAILFGLGAAETLLPSSFRRVRWPQVLPLQVFGQGPPRIAAAVGALAFVTLIIRLLGGSQAASDLLLWVVALACFAMPIVGQVNFRRPSREHAIEIGLVSLVVLVFVVLCGRDIDHWYYSAIGDEYAFYSAALGLLVDGIRRPFAQDGVYGAHPILGSLFQSMVMAVAGRNHFGWVFSSVVSTALAIPPVYLVGRALGGPGVGFIAAALFASCHYIFAFSHIGYDNILAPAPVAWTLACFVLYLRRPRPWLLYASGLAAGLGFYTYYTARTAMPILGLFILVLYGWRACLTPRGLRDRLLEIWPLLLAFGLAVTPLFAASGLNVITRMYSFVPGGYSAEITGPPGQKYLTNFWLNVPAFWVNPSSAHFTYGSLLDPITAALAALGIGLAIRWWARPLCKLVLVWTVIAVAVTALLPPHPTTAVTWLLFSIPPLTILAALAARQIWRLVPWSAVPSLTSESTQRYAAIGATAALLAVVLGLNLYRFWVASPRNMHLTPEAVTLGALRSGLCGPDSNRTILVMRGDGLMRQVLTSFGPGRNLPTFINHDQLKPGEPIALDSAGCVIVSDPADPEARQALDNLTRAHPGGSVTTFKDYAGIQTVQVFRPPATAGQ